MLIAVLFMVHVTYIIAREAEIERLRKVLEREEEDERYKPLALQV